MPLLCAASGAPLEQTHNDAESVEADGPSPEARKPTNTDDATPPLPGLFHLRGSYYNLYFRPDGSLDLENHACEVAVVNPLADQRAHWSRHGQQMTFHRLSPENAMVWPIVLRDEHGDAGVAPQGTITTTRVYVLSAEVEGGTGALEVSGVMGETPFLQTWEPGGICEACTPASERRWYACSTNPRFHWERPQPGTCRVSRRRWVPLVWEEEARAAFGAAAKSWTALSGIGVQAVAPGCVTLTDEQGSASRVADEECPEIPTPTTWPKRLSPGASREQPLEEEEVAFQRAAQAVFLSQFADEWYWKRRTTAVPLWLKGAAGVLFAPPSSDGTERYRRVYLEGSPWGEVHPGPARLTSCETDPTSHDVNPWAVLALMYVSATHGPKAFSAVLEHAIAPEDMAALAVGHPLPPTPADIADFEREWDAWVRSQLGIQGQPQDAATTRVATSRFEVRRGNELWQCDEQTHAEKRIWRGLEGERIASVEPSPDERFLLLTLSTGRGTTGETWYAIHRVDRSVRRDFDDVAEEVGLGDRAPRPLGWSADMPSFLQVRTRDGGLTSFDVGMINWRVVTCDTKDIIEVIDRHTREARACYEPLLRRNPDAAGKIALAFRIDAEGRVMDPFVRESTLPSGSAEACLLKHLSGWRFPRPRSGGNCDVDYPWIFKVAGSPDSRR